MTELKRILVATDFSSYSRAALAYAIDLAVRNQASIDLLHVWESHTYANADVFDHVDDRGPQVSQAQLEFARTPHGREMEEWMQEARARGISVLGRLESGDPAQAIVAAAARGHHDVIVMGTHGRTGLAHVVLGSVAERVTRRAPCSVLTIPGKTSVAA